MMNRALVTAVFAAALSGCSNFHEVMENPEIRFVTWGQQDPTPLESDWRILLANGVFDRLTEYGVKSGHVGSAIKAMPDIQPGTYSDAWVTTELISEVSNPQSETIYVLVLPPGVQTPRTHNGNAAYHFPAGNFGYAVVPYGSEVLVSHEIYEVATDRTGGGILVNGVEIGDPCDDQVEVIAGVTVQKVWSIRHAACE